MDFELRSDNPKSIALASIAENIEEEKCVVAQYRTNLNQKNTLKEHFRSCELNYIPIEWVIDIADESNGWFYGTAYHYDDSTSMLHVMVPDKLNPSFDGNVMLDHRTVHLIECVDGKTDALFNKIIRDSVIKVKWDVEWFEECNDESGTEANAKGEWIFSCARYYIRMANQLLVEDKDFGQDSRGFVILTCDLNLKLLQCHKNRGTEDFIRLIQENIVLSSPSAIDDATKAISTTDMNEEVEPIRQSNKISRSAYHSGGKSPYYRRDQRSNPSDQRGNPPESGDHHTSSVNNVGTSTGFIRKLSEMARGLRENMSDVLEEREQSKNFELNLAKQFNAFALEGDLDQGLKLVEHFQKLNTIAKQIDNNELDGEEVTEFQKSDVSAYEAWQLVHKLEKGLVRAAKMSTSSGGYPSNSGESRGDSQYYPNQMDDEVEYLKKNIRKVKKDLESKEKELIYLKRTTR